MNYKQKKAEARQEKKELLHRKWYDFNDYKENDYREVFNHEALYLDDIYRNGAHLNDIYFDETIEELNYDTYEVLEKIVEDIENVGLDYISMLGIGMGVQEWKTFIKRNKEDQK